MFKKNISSILVLLIFINSIGCYTFSQVNIEDAEEIEKDDKVKITTLDEEVYNLTDVKIQGSLLKGNRLEFMYRRDHGFDLEEVSIPFDQIKNIEIDKINPTLTLLTVFLIIGIPIAAFAIAMANADYH